MTEDRTNGVEPDSMDEAIIRKIMKSALPIGQNEESQFATDLDEAKHTTESPGVLNPTFRKHTQMPKHMKYQQFHRPK